MRRLRIGKSAADAEADATCMQLDDGFLRFYDADPPTDPDGRLGSQPLLAECRFGNPAFKLANNGRAEANPLLPDAATRGRGRARWFQAVKADGVTTVMDGSVGPTPRPGPVAPEDEYDCYLPAVDIVPGMELHVASFFYVRQRIAK